MLSVPGALPRFLRKARRGTKQITSLGLSLGFIQQRKMTVIGYQPDFLGPGFEVELPTFSDALLPDVLTAEDMPETDFQDGTYTKYIHYSLATNKARRQPIISALNIDQSLLKVASRGGWRNDSQVGDFQLGAAYYKNNDYDRGHLARRSSAAWGTSDEDAEEASAATMVYSNAALQHAKFNQDEWAHLENWVFDLDIDSTNKISVFSGPIYTHRRGIASFIGSPPAEIPTAFFKVACFVGREGEFETRAFIVAQDKEAISDKNARSQSLDLGAYQVPISVIEEETGLVFDDIVRNSNALEALDDGGPPIVPVEKNNLASGKTEFPDVFVIAAMCNPKGRDRGNEWISIANFGEHDVDLTGWTVSDTKRKGVSIAGIVTPGEAVRVGQLIGLTLSNTSGKIALMDPDGNVVDRVVYSERSHKIRENVPIRFHID